VLDRFRKSWCLFQPVLTNKQTSEARLERPPKYYEASLSFSLHVADDAQPRRSRHYSLLPGGNGRIDHLAVDIPGQRLFLFSRLQQHSPKFVYLKTPWWVHTIRAILKNSRKSVYVPRSESPLRGQW